MSERMHSARRSIILIPDSFKGTLSSGEICEILEEQIRKILPEYSPVSLPVADGGEGSVDAFLHAVGGERLLCRAKDPLFREIDAFFGRLADGKTGVIEMAAAAGLPLVEREKNPMRATTWGVGGADACCCGQRLFRAYRGLGRLCDQRRRGRCRCGVRRQIL